jgi:thiosulfate/3-mercaptopyruvate sulfurtransferase
MSLKSPEELKTIFESKKIELNQKNEIVTTCGSGMTASVIYLALSSIGKSDNVHLYDGSWAEYGMKPARSDADS